MSSPQPEGPRAGSDYVPDDEQADFAAAEQPASPGAADAAPEPEEQAADPAATGDPDPAPDPEAGEEDGDAEPVAEARAGEGSGYAEAEPEVEGVQEEGDAEPAPDAEAGEASHEGGEETYDEPEPEQREEPRASRSRGRHQEEESDDNDDVPQLTEKELSQARVNAAIDAAVSMSKKKTKKRKRRDGDDDLDKIADDEIDSLKNDMMAAADRDIEANQQKRPATEKLRLLPRVVTTLQKTNLQQAIMDNNLLEAVRRWLEPLQDRSLPALNVQRQLFAVLQNMQIDEISLKMSQLGRVVLFYTIRKKVDPVVKRHADRLVELWSRPILKRSSSYRTLSVPQANATLQDTGAEFDRIASKVDPKRRNVSMPQSVKTNYTYAPRGMAGASDGTGHEESQQTTRRVNRKRLNDLKYKLKQGKKT